LAVDLADIGDRDLVKKEYKTTLVSTKKNNHSNEAKKIARVRQVPLYCIICII